MKKSATPPAAWPRSRRPTRWGTRADGPRLAAANDAGRRREEQSRAGGQGVPTRRSTKRLPGPSLLPQHRRARQVFAPMPARELAADARVSVRAVPRATTPFSSIEIPLFLACPVASSSSVPDGPELTSQVVSPSLSFCPVFTPTVDAGTENNSATTLTLQRTCARASASPHWPEQHICTPSLWIQAQICSLGKSLPPCQMES